LLLSRLMNLSDAQEGVLNIAFEIADDEGLLLLDLKDLRSMLAPYRAKTPRRSRPRTAMSIPRRWRDPAFAPGARGKGAEHFFGEPALEIRSDAHHPDGLGAINVLAADKLMMNPRLYATFLLWLLSELFEELPEVGDPEKPKLVFFFDEAHLLFDEAPKILIERVEQVVRLIRSKGVGVFFVTQNPLDVPDTVLSQLGNRVQHALRAYTPREQKAVKVAADTFRPNPEFDCFEAITQLGVGEALVSTLEAKGVRPERPESRRWTLPGYGDDDDEDERGRSKSSRRKRSSRSRPGYRRQTVTETVIKSVARSAATSLGRALVRGILGSLKKGF
jgi:DNA helicase HerA-like ATPase